MDDNDKTKQQLIQELATMRRRVAQMEDWEAGRRQTDDAPRESEERYRRIVKYIPDLIWTMDNVLLEEAQRKMTAANEKLRQSEEKFSKAFHLGPVIITISTVADGKYVEVSDYFIRLTGYTKDEIIGHTAIELGIWAHQEDREKVTRILESGDRVVEEELLFQSKSRKLYTMIFSAEVVSIDDVPHLVSVAVDITERRRVEEALLQSEGKYRTIIEQMEDGYFETDLAGNFTFVNDAESRILGYPRDELVGMNNRQYQDEKNADKSYQLFSRVYTTGEPIRSLDVEIIRKNGTKGLHEVSVSLVMNAEGRPIGFSGIARDVTGRKRAEEEKQSLEERLNRAEKMEVLGRLAGGVAHDLNNILGALSGYSELLLMEIPGRMKARSHVEKIMRSTEKGAAIIQDLLTLARRGVTTSDVINLNQVVSSFLKTPVFDNIKGNHPLVTFKIENQEVLLNIKGSSVHLEKTLMNLVSNAAESISGIGKVTIQTENRYLDSAIKGYDEVTEGDYVTLIVSDTGMGIPVENREKIFEPFYTKKTMGRSGTGLGLAIVWGTVKDLNGYIDVQTEMGVGTTFTLYFPVTREELITPQQKEPIERYLGSGESILVIDDIVEQRDVASRLLKKLGYKVHAVSSGEEAVEYLKGNKADILVLDMIMAPGMDGLEAYQRILGINPKQKAILVSGFAETHRVREAQRLGAGAYVKKPYVMEKIGMAIRDELNR